MASQASTHGLASEQKQKEALEETADSHAGTQQPVIPPTDDEILMQANIIRAEEAEKMPYVGDIEPIEDLKQEYVGGSQIFVQKIEKMAAGGYGAVRRTRGDGNCFFRGFVFGYLEALLKSNDLVERDRFEKCIGEWKDKLMGCGFQELVFEDAMELLLEQVRAIGRPGSSMTLDALESNFRDDSVSNMVVMFLRMITSCEIRRRQDFFGAFIAGMYDDPAASSVDSFCCRFVEPMGEESDHLHCVAITDALQIPVRVVYLDRSGGGDDGATEHNFVPDGLPQDSDPRVHLLYRPGHYDVLYLKG